MLVENDTEVATMELTGKKINFLGDSITEGAGASSPEICYVADMHRLYNLAAARNYGIGGTRIAPQKEVSAEPVWDQDFLGRYAKMDDDADFVVVFGGTNDFGHGLAPFGQVGDTTPDTFCGACDTLYKGLKAKYPRAKLAVITPTPRSKAASPKGEGNKPAGHVLADYVDAIKQIAATNGLPVLDLFHPHPVGKSEAFPPEIFVDGLHPSDAGHAVLAKLIGEFLQTL